MAFLSAFKKSIRNSCYGFSALTILYSLIMLIVVQQRYGDSFTIFHSNMSVVTVLLFFPLCFILSLTNEMLKESRLNELLRALVRYASLLFALGMCVLLPNRDSVTGNVVIVLFAAVTLMYALGAWIYAKHIAKSRVNLSKNSEYKSVYRSETRK